MRTVNMHEAKTHLSRLVEEVGRGETIVIANRGRPVARLTSMDDGEDVSPRRTGFLRGRFVVPDDFDRMHEDVIADAFDGRS